MAEDLAAFVARVIPFWGTLGIELREVGPGASTLEVAFQPAHLQNGVMHGGVVASLIDSACAVAALSRIWPEAYAASISLAVSYLRPVTGGRLIARGECLRAGRNVSFCEAKVWNDAGELVAFGSSQLMRIPLGPPTGGVLRKDVSP
jgi:uncharacterized protein (TIGR00369 family)